MASNIQKTPQKVKRIATNTQKTPQKVKQIDTYIKYFEFLATEEVKGIVKTFYKCKICSAKVNGTKI